MRDALSLTDQVLSMGDGAVGPDRVRDALGLVAEDEFLALLDLLAERRAGDVFGFVARLADVGIDFGQFLTGFADMVRGLLAVTLDGVPPEVSDRAREALVARRGTFDAGDLLRMLSAVTELEPRFRKSGQQQLLLEALLVRFALLDRTVSLEAVLRGIGGGGGGTIDEDRPPRRAAPAAAAPAAPAAIVSSTDSPPDVSRVVERWDDLVSAVRGAGKSLAATALEHASAVAVTARGDVTIALDEANPIYEQALETVKGDLAELLRQWFGGVQRVAVRAAAAGTPQVRLTDEMARSERLATLRRRDPVLGAAIDALDLDLAD
jgi:DNA polymerase-3 subunit gamma/tau